MVKLFFTAFGVVAGMAGLLLSIFFYFTTLSAINGAQTALDSQINAAYNAAADGEAAVAALDATLAGIPPTAGNMSTGLAAMQGATRDAAASMNSIADSLAAIPPPFSVGDVGALRSSANQLSASSASFGAGAASSAELAQSSGTLRADIAQVRGDMAQAKASIGSAKQVMANSFNALRFSALILALMFFLAFALLISYSLSAFI